MIMKYEVFHQYGEGVMSLKLMNERYFELIRYKVQLVQVYFFLGAAFFAAFLAAGFLAAGFLAAFLAGFFAAFLAAGFLAAFFGFLAAFLAGFLAFFGFLALGFLGFLAFFGFSTLTTLYDPAPFPEALAILRAPLATPRLRARRTWTAALAASTL